MFRFVASSASCHRPKGRQEVSRNRPNTPGGRQTLFVYHSQPAPSTRLLVVRPPSTSLVAAECVVRIHGRQKPGVRDPYRSNLTATSTSRLNPTPPIISIDTSRSPQVYNLLRRGGGGEGADKYTRMCASPTIASCGAVARAHRRRRRCAHDLLDLIQLLLEPRDHELERQIPAASVSGLFFRPFRLDRLCRFRRRVRCRGLQLGRLLRGARLKKLIPVVLRAMRTVPRIFRVIVHRAIWKPSLWKKSCPDCRRGGAAERAVGFKEAGGYTKVRICCQT